MLKNIIKRALFYIQQGYSLAALPFAFLGYASSIYYLAIKNIPFLLKLFPTFETFLIIAGLTLPFFCGIVGLIYMKKSFLYRESQHVMVESNPYQVSILPPIYIPLWNALVGLLKKEGIDTTEIEKILKNSRKAKEKSTYG